MLLQSFSDFTEKQRHLHAIRDFCADFFVRFGELEYTQFYQS